MIPTVEMIEAGWKATLGLNKLQVERIIVAALRAAPGPSSVVKPLNWIEHPGAFPAPLWSAQTPFGFYNIEEVSGSDRPSYEVRLHAHHLVSVKDAFQEAQEAAQADYEARLLSTRLPPPSFEEQMIELAKTAIFEGMNRSSFAQLAEWAHDKATEGET